MSLALASLSAVLGAAPAALGSGFSLVQKDCPELDEHTLRELVELELRTLSVSNSRVHVEISCSDEIAAVSLTDADGHPYPIASRVDFSKAGRGARERLVALAATELVAQAEHAERPGAAQPKEAAAPPVAAPAAVEARPSVEDTPPAARSDDAGPRIELALVAVGTVTGTPTTVLGGGALSVRMGIAGPWVAAFDVRVDTGTSDSGTAKVTWTMFGGSAALLFERRLGVARLGVGAGARAARLGLEANATTPDTGHTVTGAWFGPMLPARASFALGAAVALVATLEAGYVALPVRGTDDRGEPVVEADGPWASLGVGIAAVF